MSENNKEDISHFGIKIENMLDELIKSDDELDNNQMRNSLKFSEDNSLSEEKNKMQENYSIQIFFLIYFLLLKNKIQIHNKTIKVIKISQIPAFIK